MTCLLELISLNKTFLSGETLLPILKGLDLCLQKGETLAITGPSGSGKSTLLGLMAGLERPTSGRIVFEGQDIQLWDEDRLASWRREKIGFIFQNFRLVKSLTALENVALPLEILGYGLRDAKEKAHSLLTSLGLSERCHHFPHQMSGGEQQRVAIARAYIHEPQIIFADEPTGSLDPASAEKILHTLLSLNQERQTTLVVVTHSDAISHKLSRNFRLREGEKNE